MTDPFLLKAQQVLRDKVQSIFFEKSVSLRIKDLGNLLLSGHEVEISDARADCAVKADQATFERILNGELNPIKAAMFGKLKIVGDAKTAMKFGKLFD